MTMSACPKTGRAPEVKSATPNAVLNAEFDGFMREFELYKEENDRRLAEIEKREIGRAHV